MIADPFQQFVCWCCSSPPPNAEECNDDGDREEADESIDDEEEDEERSLSDNLVQTLDERPRTQKSFVFFTRRLMSVNRRSIDSPGPPILPPLPPVDPGEWIVDGEKDAVADDEWWPPLLLLLRVYRESSTGILESNLEDGIMELPTGDRRLRPIFGRPHSSNSCNHHHFHLWFDFDSINGWESKREDKKLLLSNKLHKHEKQEEVEWKRGGLEIEIKKRDEGEENCDGKIERKVESWWIKFKLTEKWDTRTRRWMNELKWMNLKVWLEWMCIWSAFKEV